MCQCMDERAPCQDAAGQDRDTAKFMTSGTSLIDIVGMAPVKVPRVQEAPRLSAYNRLMRALERETDGDAQGAVHEYQRLLEVMLHEGGITEAILFARRMVLLDPDVAAHRIELAELYARDGRIVRPRSARPSSVVGFARDPERDR